jgi:hypothetical protein
MSPRAHWRSSETCKGSSRGISWLGLKELIMNYRHVKLITGLMFWFLHPDQNVSPLNGSSIPIDFTCVQYTVCIHTQSDIWMPETEISDHKFPFCHSAPHVGRYDVASCTAHTFTGVASLCWMWRQWRYIRWVLQVNLAHFLDVYNPKIVYTWI